MPEDRRAYDTGVSGDVQTTLQSIIGPLEKLIGERDRQVKAAMSDFRADGVEEDYQDVERRWNKAAGQVNQIIGLIRTTLHENDGIAERTVSRSRGIVQQI